MIITIFLTVTLHTSEMALEKDIETLIIEGAQVSTLMVSSEY